MLLNTKKILRNLLFSSVDNIQKFILKHNYLVLFHVKAFFMKIFAQDNEISLGWIASKEKKILLVEIDNLSEISKYFLFFKNSLSKSGFIKNNYSPKFFYRNREVCDAWEESYFIAFFNLK